MRLGMFGEYRFGFQGQEAENELTGQTGSHSFFKYRISDNRIGRFFAVDPLTKKYPHYSPYNFSGNKLIAFRELEGLEELPYNDPSLTMQKSRLDNMGYHSASKDGPVAGNFEEMVRRSDEPSMDKSANILAGFGSAAVTGIFVVNYGVAAFGARLGVEVLESVAEELTGIPIVPIAPDPTDALDPQINKQLYKKSSSNSSFDDI